MPLFMHKRLTISLMTAVGAALLANAALAAGTAADAKAMLDKTAAALQSDKTKTLDEINTGESGFLVGDIILSASI
jgi:hypothetical protein